MQRWEEILFKDRNKSYGSYQLRKKYTKYLLWGFLIALLLVAIPIIVVYIQSHRTEDYTNLPYIVSVELDKPPDLESSFSPPPMEERKITEQEFIPLVVDTVIPESESKKVEKITLNKDSDTITIANKGNSKSGNGFDINGDSASLYVYIDNYPEFPGGIGALNNFISQNVIYPGQAEKQRIQGKVIVQFMVTKNGEVRNIVIKKSIHPLLDKEALRVVGMFPRWKPARRKGLPINLQYTLPICFKLNLTTTN
jgi:protein TonB